MRWPGAAALPQHGSGAAVCRGPTSKTQEKVEVGAALPTLQRRVAHHLAQGYFSSQEASSPAVPLFRETPRPTNNPH